MRAMTTISAAHLSGFSKVKLAAIEIIYSTSMPDRQRQCDVYHYHCDCDRDALGMRMITGKAGLKGMGPSPEEKDR